jgi:hypothetical protein
MKTFIRLMICAAAACSLATACDKERKQRPEPSVSGTEVAAVRDIALEVYELIPKDDLPFFCLQTKRDTAQDANAEPFNPLSFNPSVQGSEIGEDPGLYGVLNLHCYPLENGGWRAYWAAYGGMDGLCGFWDAKAYNYVDGKLTAVEKDPFYQLLGEFMWANDGAHIELVNDAVSVNQVNQIGHEENLAYFRWNGITFGDAD